MDPFSFHRLHPISTTFRLREKFGIVSHQSVKEIHSYIVKSDFTKWGIPHSTLKNILYCNISFDQMKDSNIITHYSTFPDGRDDGSRA